MTSRRTIAIVNPRSANGATGREWPKIAAAIRELIGPFDEAMTHAPRDATGIARRALSEGYKQVISIGGDGTNNEVANGFFADGAGAPVAPDAVLALVPAGTGGDFRRTFDIPIGLPKCVAHLAGENTRAIDAGRLVCRGYDGSEQRRIFINITSIGIGGEVDEAVNQTTKIFGGFVSFLVGSLRTLARYQNKMVRFRLDDRPWQTERILNLVIANGRYFGGGMHVAPNAQPDDGRFDVIVLGDISLARNLASMRRIYQGTHLGQPQVSTDYARRVEVQSAERVLIDMDGEMPGMLPAVIELLPAAINLKVAG